MEREVVSRDVLRSRLSVIDGKGYKAYKRLEGAYDFGRYHLFIDHVQGDPFAPPSAVRVRVDQRLAHVPSEFVTTRIRRVAAADYLARQFESIIRVEVKGHRGSGKSGFVQIDAGHQEVLDRTAMLVTEEFVEARISVGLPAYGRRVSAREALAIFFQEIPSVVEQSLIAGRINAKQWAEHVSVVEDQEVLRECLDEQGLVAFVGDGSILPRLSGASDLPLSMDRTILFESPATLKVEVMVPNAGKITGMGIPKGVTLVVGGGYHGKSTLLRAIERGVYNHIPGDGRERVITVAGAVKIRAEDGRAVENVDLTSFITDLPMGKKSDAFSTDDASGSTSQAANIIEAMEVGAELLLLDEDTSATNFMLRDARMQTLVAKGKEPITPFLDRVRELFAEQGVSTMLVMGGSGDYFDAADQVIMMDEFRPLDVTAKARDICRQRPSARRREICSPLTRPPARIPLPRSFPPPKLGRPLKFQAKGLYQIIVGSQTIDLSSVDQLVDESQTRAISAVLSFSLRHLIDGTRSLSEIVSAVEHEIRERGLDHLTGGFPRGDLALPRRFELAAAINRLRGVQMKNR